MPLYNDTQVGAILQNAASSLFRIQNKSEVSRYFDGDSSKEEQVRILYSLKKAVEWGKEKELETDEYNALVAYLYRKCEKESMGLGYNQNPTVEGVTESDSILNYLFEFFVSSTPAIGYPASTETSWTRSEFLNRTVEVEYGGLPIPGLVTTDGSIYFLKPLGSNTLQFYNLPGGLAEGALLKVRAWATV